MRQSVWASLALLLLWVAPVGAQSWEAGGAGGFGFANNASVTGGVGSAVAGLGSGASFGGVLTHHMYDRLSGDLRYTYRTSDLQLSGVGQNTSFKARSHMVHYDLLYHFASREARVRPFVAIGGGMRMFQGVGPESAYQPLEDLALLTRTKEYQPLITGGAGVNMALSDRVSLRVEFRDFITPFPKEVIAPAPGAKASGWLHDFVPMLGISYRFPQ